MKFYSLANLFNFWTSFRPYEGWIIFDNFIYFDVNRQFKNPTGHVYNPICNVMNVMMLYTTNFNLKCDLVMVISLLLSYFLSILLCQIILTCDLVTTMTVTHWQPNTLRFHSLNRCGNWSLKNYTRWKIIKIYQ